MLKSHENSSDTIVYIIPALGEKNSYSYLTRFKNYNSFSMLGAGEFIPPLQLPLYIVQIPLPAWAWGLIMMLNMVLN